MLTKSLVSGAFTRSALWWLDSIEQTAAGAWCYQPGIIPPINALHCSDITLTALPKTHIENSYSTGLSIVYYDLADLVPLGGAEWTMWNTTRLPVGVCLSGEAPLGGARKAHFLSVCRYSKSDDDHDSPLAHEPDCVAIAAQKFVGDGCYTTPASEPKLTGPTALALAILGAIAAVIAISGAVWSLGQYILKRNVRRAARFDVVNEVPLEERPTIHAEVVDPGSG